MDYLTLYTAGYDAYTSATELPEGIPFPHGLSYQDRAIWLRGYNAAHRDQQSVWA